MKRPGKSRSSERLTWRVNAAVGLGSLIIHTFELFGLGQLYRPAENGPSGPVERSAEVAYIKLTPIRQALPTPPASMLQRDEDGAHLSLGPYTDVPE